MGITDFLKQTKVKQDESSDVREVRIIVEPAGSPGTKIFGGYIDEEYFSELKHHRKAEFYDEMRRSDAEIAMVLAAVKNPIRAASWTIETDNPTPQGNYLKEFVEHCIFDDRVKSWRETLDEVLTMIDFGFTLLECTNKIVYDHKQFGTYIGIQNLGWRSPRTIYRWNVDNLGDLMSVTQYAYGDLQKYVDIPAQYLYHFALNMEGSNYEGISMLRPCYGAWLRKKKFLQLMAIGIEKTAVPTPIGTVPDGKYGSDEYKRFTEVLQQYTSFQKQWITVPDGWKIDFPDTKFEADKIRVAIDGENKEIVKAFLANFLELGLGSTSGSYSMSFNLSDFFLGGIEHIADIITEVFNKQIIPDLIKLNFGPQNVYPELRHAGITDKAGDELAKVLESLCRWKVIIPDDQLEEDVRKRYGLPKMSLQGQRQTQVQAGIAGGNIPHNIDLAEKQNSIKFAQAKNPKSLIGQEASAMRDLMQTGLRAIADNMIKTVMNKSRRLTDSQILNAIKNVETAGVRDYQAQLKDHLTGVSVSALKQAYREVPSKSKIKFVESFSGIGFDDYDKLPTVIQNVVLTRAQLLAQTQAADLEKAIYFQFVSSVQTTDSDKLLEADLDGAADQYIEGASVVAAAGNSVAETVNNTRNDYFFSDGVLDNIESFTFTNGDPISPICQDLAGTTFAVDDPEAERYYPPLHHNCKSYLVPNLKGEGTEDDIESLKPSDPDLEKYITLSEKRGRK